MSRIGKSPITIPSGVVIAINDNVVEANGKLGKASYVLPNDVSIQQDNNVLNLIPAGKKREHRTSWGTSRSQVQNIVQGVSEGFEKKLEINGVGYRAAMQGSELVLQLGFSHDVNFPVPEGISIKCDSPTAITVSGVDKQKVGQVASKIRSYRPPEPYKGKGVKYAGEQILRKEGKKK